MLAALVTEVQIDPATVRPSPLSLVVFLFLATALVLLLVSMLRHMKRARVNLAPPPPDQGGSPQDPGAAQNGPGRS